MSDDRITEVTVSVTTKDARPVSYSRFLNHPSEADVRNAILDAGSRMIDDCKERELL